MLYAVSPLFVNALANVFMGAKCTGNADFQNYYHYKVALPCGTINRCARVCASVMPPEAINLLDIAISTRYSHQFN